MKSRAEWTAVALVLTGGLALSLWTSQLAGKWRIDARRIEFLGDSENIAASFRREAESNLTLVEATAAYFAGSEEVAPAEFQEFVAGVNSRSKSLATLGWVDLESAHAGTYPIKYLEPAVKPSPVTAEVLNGDPAWRSLIEAAARSKFAEVSMVVRLAGTGGAASVVVAKAVHRPRSEKVQGIVFSILPVGALLEHGLTYLKRAGIDIRVVDRTAGGDLLYTHPSRFRKDKSKVIEAGPPPFQTTASLALAGRTWVLECDALRFHRGFADEWERWALLVGGVLLTLLIAITQRNYIRDARRIRRVIERRTAQLDRKNLQLREEIAGHRRTEAELRASEERLKLAQDAAGIGAWEMDFVTGTSVFSDVYCRLFDVPPGTNWASQEDWLARIYPDDQDRVRKALARSAEGTHDYEEEYRVVWNDGSVHAIFAKAKIIFSADGKPLRILGADMDITRRMEAEEALRESEHRMRDVFAQAAIGMAIMDLEGRCREVNEALARISGYSQAELLGMPLQELAGRNATLPLLRAADRLVRGELPSIVVEQSFVRKGGEAIWARVSLSVRRDRGAATHLVALIEDISAVRQAQKLLQHQANHDALTGLPNRKLLGERMKQALASAKQTGALVALLYIDLDGFKLINDTFGHPLGDDLLVDVASRLGAAARAGDTLARVGGDEFIMVAAGVTDDAEAKALGERLLRVLERPFRLNGNDVSLGASIGVCLYPRDGLETETLLGHADSAMYAAKNSGKRSVVMFAPEMSRQSFERFTLEQELRHAHERGELYLVYQPQFEVSTKGLMGYEILLRWHHPNLGEISPVKFIPVAETSGMIIPIGKWVLREACTAAAAWQNDSRSGVRVAVNVSALQFVQPDFMETVAEALADTGLAPELLELELTESLLVHDLDAAAQRINELQELGVRVSIDDFGTGYSSLSYLDRLPTNKVKVDRQFVRELSESTRSQSILSSLIALAHNVGMSVTVEGVETDEQFRIVHELGCDEVQGFLLGRPERLAVHELTAAGEDQLQPAG